MARRRAVILFPVFGIILFILLYLLAASIYPGLSTGHHRSMGFDWLENYWCDLVAPDTRDGFPNPSRPLALTAAAVLCFSLSLLWYQLPYGFFHVLSIRRARNLGIAAMCLSFFIFTDFHDDVIYLAGLLGMTAHLILARKLWQQNYRAVFWSLVFCLLLFCLNFLVYETGLGLLWLPLLQKFTFMIYLLWACGMSVFTYRSMEAAPH